MSRDTLGDFQGWNHPRVGKPRPLEVFFLSRNNTKSGKATPIFPSPTRWEHSAGELRVFFLLTTTDF